MDIRFRVTMGVLLATMATNVAAATLEDTIVSDGAVVYWRFDETNKSSGQTAFNLGSAGAAGNGTYLNSVVNITDTPVAAGGNAARFDNVGGSTDRVRLSGFSSIPTSAITVAGWIRGNAGDVSQPTVFSYDLTGQGNELLLINNGAGDTWSLYANGTQNVFTGVTESELLDGEWHHFAVTWDSVAGSAQFYVDAALEQTLSVATGTPISAGGTFVLAQEQDSLDGGFDANQRLLGDLDEIAIFNSVLTQAQIQEQFLAAAATVPEPASFAIWGLMGLAALGVCFLRAVRRRSP